MVNLILHEGQQGCLLTSLMSREGSGWGKESHSESGTDLDSQEINKGAGVEGANTSQTPYL